MSGAAAFQRTSSNRKLATIERVPYPHKAFKFRPTPRAPFCCSTFVSIASTCSNSCAFKRGPNGEPGGCYVDSDSFMRRAMVKLDGAGRTPAQAIDDEVRLLDGAFTRRVASNPNAPRIPQDGARGGRDLRLHVGGDVPDAASARKLGAAAARWLARGGGRVWTFTHGWAEIPREAFGPISVLASVEREHQVAQAVAQGFAPALVAAKFPGGKRPFDWGGVSFVPCPAKTLGKTCVSCRLCLDADGLKRRGQGIAFEVHGQGAAVAAAALVPLRVRRIAA